MQDRRKKRVPPGRPVKKPAARSAEKRRKGFFNGVDEYGTEAEASLGTVRQDNTGRSDRISGFSLFQGKKRRASKKKKRKRFGFVSSGGLLPRGMLFFGFLIRLRYVITLALVLVLSLYTFFSNSNPHVSTPELTVVGLDSGLEGCRIMVLSDLNGKRFGDEQSSLLRALNTNKVDLLFLCGDMVGSSGDPEPLYELLDGLSSSVKVFFICGDSDPGPYVDTPRDIEGTLTQLVLEDWILGCIDRGATYVDQPVSVKVGTSTVWITPSTLLNLDIAELRDSRREQTTQEEEGTLANLASDRRALPITSYRKRIAENTYETMKTMKQTDFYICLSHEVPDTALIKSAQSKDSVNEKYLPAPDLLLAGHYCSGVWRIPFAGAFYIPDDSLPRNGWFPPQDRAHGFRSINETHVYTTGGLSVNSRTVFPFRLFNSPEISIITLSAQLPESMLTA